MEALGRRDTVTQWVFGVTPLLWKNMSLASEYLHRMIDYGYLRSGHASRRPVAFPIP